MRITQKGVEGSGRIIILSFATSCRLAYRINTTTKPHAHSHVGITTRTYETRRARRIQEAENFQTIGRQHEGGKVVRPCTGRLYPQEISLTETQSTPRVIVPIGNRTRYLPPCKAVLQLTAPTRTPKRRWSHNKMTP